ncbi:MAG: hypothetical protein O3A36_00175 [bacterium]|nr:hypothetical protein [bacterium]
MSTRVARYGFLLLLTVAAIKVALFTWSFSQYDFQTYSTETPLSIWDRWDAQAYKTIAAGGYTSTTVAPDYRAFLSHFPPVYPITIKIVSLLFFAPLTEAAMLVSFMAIMSASYLMYKLVFDLYKSIPLAFLSVLLLNLYPTSYFTIAPYTESLFIFFIISSFYLLNKYPHHAYFAGVMGGLAVLTRLLGIAVIPAYIYIIWQKYRGKKGTSLASIASDFLLLFYPIVAVGVYLAINKHYFGNPLFFLQEYATNPFSAKTTSWPLQETFQSLILIIQNAVQGIWDAELMNTTGWGALFTTFALLVTIAGFFTRIRKEWTIFGLSYLVLFSSFRWGISNARYSFAIFSMFIVLGSIKNKWVVSLISICFIFLLLYFSRIYTSGAWAF